MNYEAWMNIALDLGRESESEVPVGAVLVGPAGVIYGQSANRREKSGDPTSHAEIEVIRQAGLRKKQWRLDDATLFVTLEPCVMCAGAIVSARIPRVVFGAWDARAGASGSLYDILRDARLGKPVEVVSGILEPECRALLINFFVSSRASD